MSDPRPILIVLTPTPSLPPHLDLSPYTVHHLVHPPTHPATDTAALDALTETFETSQPFSILSFSSAAPPALHFACFPSASLRSVIAYYPPSLPAAAFHPSVTILVHVAGGPVPAPARNLRVKHYPHALPGFAEADASGYDGAAAELAWMRSVEVLRATLGPAVDVEAVVPMREALELAAADEDVCVEFVPTGMVARGYAQVRRLYEVLWGGERPTGWCWDVRRRTVGSVQVVDEVRVRFWHDVEVGWCLPGVPPSGRRVEFDVVVMVRVAEGRVKEWRCLWDRAGVWAQVGLLEGLGARGGLQVVGGEV